VVDHVTTPAQKAAVAGGGLAPPAAAGLGFMQKPTVLWWVESLSRQIAMAHKAPGMNAPKRCPGSPLGLNSDNKLRVAQAQCRRSGSAGVEFRFIVGCANPVVHRPGRD